MNTNEGSASEPIRVEARIMQAPKSSKFTRDLAYRSRALAGGAACKMPGSARAFGVPPSRVYYWGERDGWDIKVQGASERRGDGTPLPLRMRTEPMDIHAEPRPQSPADRDCPIGGDPIRVSHVLFSAAPSRLVRSGLLGWVSCLVNGKLELDGLSIRRTRAGRRTVSFPSRKDGSGRERFYVRPIDDAARLEIELQILAALGLVDEKQTSS